MSSATARSDAQEHAQRVVFGTKAETLERLQGRLSSATVLGQYYFSVARWRSEPEKVRREIRRHFPTGLLAVRSSALCEDGGDSSMAGAFVSRLAVDAGNDSELREAIETVVDSYSGDPGDQVLVQPMLDDIAVCGVIMSHELERGAPYHVIDYDDRSGRTDTITGGTGTNKAVMVYRRAPVEDIRSPRVRRFVQLAREVEDLCGGLPVDIEFVLGRAGELFLLQARRISLHRNWRSGTEVRVTRQLGFVAEYVAQRQEALGGVLGSKTILASMPDWNPAEIIGSTPRPLAASLYQELVTRRVWRTSRAAMGYREVPPVELMVMMGGHPLIDVRHSFNSFLPRGLSPQIGESLVDAWIERLAEHPELHDKVEFEIVPTCRDFCFEQSMWERYPGLLSAEDLRAYERQLGALTSEMVSTGPEGSLSRAMAAVSQLEGAQRRRGPISQRASAGHARLADARELLDECGAVGTFAFSIVARHAFVAEALLRSAVSRGVLSAERVASFKRSVPTITRSLMRDFASTLEGKQDPAAFMRMYGHLRPGTYDVTSLRYDERDDLFAHGVAPVADLAEPAFSFTAEEHRGVGQLLAQAGLTGTSDELFTYAARAIAGREYAKFVFTRNLSDALAIMVEWGEGIGLDREDLSFLDWPSLAGGLCQPALDHIDRVLIDRAEEGRRGVASGQLLKLSHIIRDTNDIYVVPVHRSRPNFIGQGRVEGEVMHLGPHSPTHMELAGKIVCVENADPGFDWIFTKGIKALMTKFGGPNSHMSIRCAEFGLIAAIGCGEQTFERLVAAKRIEIDCADKTLRAVMGA